MATKKQVTKSKSTRRQTKKAGDGEVGPENIKQPVFQVPVNQQIQQKSLKQELPPTEFVEPTNTNTQPEIVEPPTYAEPAPADQQQYVEPEPEPAGQQYEEPEPEPEPIPEEPSKYIEPEYVEEPLPKKKKTIGLIIFTIISTIFSVGILASGLYILLRRSKYTNTLAATITNASCEPGTLICTIDIKYSVNNSEYVQKNISVKSLFKVNDTVNILYDSENPNNFVLEQPKWINISISTFLIVLSIILLIVTWWYYSKH